MPQESNHFEEAARLCTDTNPFVSRVADVLYQHMLTEHLRNKTQPKFGFNILYFFQTVIKSLLELHPDIELNTTEYPYECPPIKAVNWPPRIDIVNGDRSVWNKFATFVRADSVSMGDEFDVSYAMKIISLTGDIYFNVKVRGGDSIKSGAEWDYWLLGFSDSSYSE